MSKRVFIVDDDEIAAAFEMLLQLAERRKKAQEQVSKNKVCQSIIDCDGEPNYYYLNHNKPKPLRGCWGYSEDCYRCGPKPYVECGSTDRLYTSCGFQGCGVYRSC